MREIWFRGKRVDGKGWVYGGCVQAKSGKVYIFQGNDGYKIVEDDCCEVIPETVGQFTGLTDKNVTKIFEGDKTDGGEIVVFEDGVFGTTYEGNTQGVSMLSNMRCKYMEIIGNIHDKE